MTDLQETPVGLSELFDLRGQVALITGGSRGLGVQLAEALSEFGAKLILTARKAQDLDDTVAALRAKGIDAYGMCADLSDETAAQPLIDAILADHRRLDILVNNAGATWGEPAETHSVAGWNRVINLNLTGLFLLTQAAGRTCFIPQRSGRILNVASVEGLVGHHWEMTGTIAYNAAKGAVVNMTRALAAEWGRHNINVNALAPGYFPSKMTASTIDRHGELLLSGTPLGRLGGRNDLKGAALLLCSAAGRHISGQILAIDGGALAI